MDELQHQETNDEMIREHRDVSLISWCLEVGLGAANQGSKTQAGTKPHSPVEGRLQKRHCRRPGELLHRQWSDSLSYVDSAERERRK